MPRRGQGQKVQTATGQQYGQAKAQEEAQAMTPLPSMRQPAPPVMAPGQAAFARPTERPNESIMTPGTPLEQQAMKPDEQRAKVMAFLPALEEMSSSPYASPHLRNTVRRLKAYVGDTSDFADRGVPTTFEET